MTRHGTLALMVVLLATSATGSALQPAVQFARLDVSSFAGARSIVTGDFDRDGWIDMAHANAGRNSVTVLLNNGNGASGFTRTFDVPVGPAPFDLTSADFNQDGVLDLAVTHGSGSSIAILRGQANGGFTRTDVAAPAGPRGIAAADINKDGRLDLIVSGWDAGAIRVLLGTASGGFANGQLIQSTAPRPQGVGVSDFNHDGHFDLIVAHESGNGLVLFSGNAGSFGQPRSMPGMSNLNVLTIGDFNRDGWSDVAAASSSGNRVGVYVGGASGLQFHRSYATGDSPRGITARDINYDGLLDLIIANRDGDSVSVLLGDATAPGTFAPAHTFAAGAGSRAVVAEDFDRDGRIDLATGNQDAASVTVLWNDMAFDRAAFTFQRLSLGMPSNEIGGSRPLPADFNEDGKLDVVIKPGFFEAGPVVHVVLTDGPTVTLRYQQFSGSGGYEVADFNRDGHMDVMLIDAGENSVVLLLPYFGDGRGGFTPGPQTPIASPNRALTVGDVNSDTIPDVVFVSFDPGARSYFLQVLIGRGDGRFDVGSHVNTPDFSSAVNLAEVTRDGKMDVLAFVRGTLMIFPGDGAGNLGPGSATRFSDEFLSKLELADLNRDGFLDAVVGDRLQVSVAIGRADGFDAPTVIRLQRSSNNSAVKIVDIDLDGALDIVGAAGYIMRGRGDGTFGPDERFEWDGLDLAVVDFTRDGLPDILTPTTNGAIDVIVNERNSVNHPPTVSAGSDQTFEYAAQFFEEPPQIFAAASDPDVHDLTYEWRNQQGAVVTGGPNLRIRDLAHGTYTFVVTVRDGRGGTASDTVRVTIVPTTEIVLWAGTGFPQGTFSPVDDSTAAGGVRVYDQNLGRPKVNTPVAFPDNHLFLNFVADPTQTYKLWVRLKADANHFSNDSLWLQFSGSTDVQGTAKYRVGTTSALAANLEECNGCGISGWGWADDGWGAPNLNGVMLRFPAGGHQTIVVQTREDGVSIDQVVLSSSRYATTRPGPAKNDTTILPVTFVQEQ
jgi:FG-GAP-like repeat/K319L-like, PKD domain